ncbi:putative rna exonuclease [Erysiphe necator]|uniref:Putative rna exonuclease n=1 Tax=Uncinula necator TaxID=52586 RepID=A0A0B1P1A2_UNCNE|nr:putative rna exonuclease [Erysiphe necator]
MCSVTGAAKRLPVPLPDIKFSELYLKYLRRLVQSKAVLKQNGYIVDQLSVEEIERKKRCYRCGQLFKKGKISTQKESYDSTSKITLQQKMTDLHLQDNTISSINQEKRSQEAVNHSVKTKSEVEKKHETGEPVMRCRFHSGTLKRQHWNCCYQFRYSKGCQQAENHICRNYKEGELEAYWKYYTTPKKYPGFMPRHAVALDCEMGRNKYGETELIRLSAIDYFSSEVLIDSLVYPDAPMGDYNTRYSGVSFKQMEDAYRNRLCILGKDAAREALWKFVGPKTIVVGHSANNDLSALRWIHELVIDTMLIDYLEYVEEEKRAEINKKKAEAKTAEVILSNVEKTYDKSGDKSGNLVLDNTLREKKSQKSRGSGRFSLKILTKERIGRSIQQGRSGHDSLEDATAARDLAHWNVIYKGKDDLILI